MSPHNKFTHGIGKTKALVVLRVKSKGPCMQQHIIEKAK